MGSDPQQAYFNSLRELSHSLDLFKQRLDAVDFGVDFVVSSEEFATFCADCLTTFTQLHHRQIAAPSGPPESTELLSDSTDEPVAQDFLHTLD